MKCAIITTYPPRECGIATFTEDLYNNMLPNDDIFIVAMNNPGESYDYPEEVQLTIEQDELEEYQKAAEYINEHADICMLQHEFNIFGGRNGIFILSLLNRLTIPLVSNLHTVLDKPSDAQQYIINEITRLSGRNIVLSQSAADILHASYDTDSAKTSMIRHPVLDISITADSAKKKLGLEEKEVMLTFGLINRNKGIETVLKALPAVVEKHPEVRYIVLGKTHPAIKKEFGEEYRNYLEDLTRELGIEQYVVFENRFVEAGELKEYLAATDVLITPYLNEAQVSSGPLSFAMGVGAALVSTPYWHAKELLADGRGMLFDFRDYEALSESLQDLFGNREMMNNMRKKVRVFGKKITWPLIGEDYYLLMSSEHEKYKKNPDLNKQKCVDYPKVSFKHLQKLTDDTAVISDATYGFARLKSGYHIRYNARALLAACMAYQQTENDKMTPLISRYLSFLQYMQIEDGSFVQQLGFDKDVIIKNASESDTGLSLWALGYLIHYPPENTYQELAKEMFLRTVSRKELTNLQAIAYTIIGLYHYMEKYRDDQMISERLHHYIEALKQHYVKNTSGEWKWFDSSIDFDAAALPMAMYYASEFKQEKGLLDKATEATDFLSSIVLTANHLSLIGQNQEYTRGSDKGLFDQHPTDAMSMIMLFNKAFERTGNKAYYKHVFTCYKWFFGINDLFIDLYDPVSRGCYDGLQQDGFSRNQGAASTIALILSGIEVKNAKSIYKNSRKKISNKQNSLLLPAAVF